MASNPTYAAIMRAMQAAKRLTAAGVIVAGASACEKDAGRANSGNTSATKSEVPVAPKPPEDPFLLTKRRFDYNLHQLCKGDAATEECYERARKLGEECFLHGKECNQLCAELSKVNETLGHSKLTYCELQPEAEGQAPSIVTERSLEPVFPHVVIRKGRPPAGYEANVPNVEDPIGRWLAESAVMELASVRAFHQLHELLQTIDCPSDLLSRILDAAAEEEDHAFLMASLSAAEGVDHIGSYSSEKPSLDGLQVDNLVHGCLGEALASAVAAYQAEHAAPNIAGVMAKVAMEEATHAALSWDIFTWVQDTKWKLVKGDCLSVINAWKEQTSEQVAEPAREVLGLPAANVEQAMRIAIAEQAIAHLFSS